MSYYFLSCCLPLLDAATFPLHQKLFTTQILYLCGKHLKFKIVVVINNQICTAATDTFCLETRKTIIENVISLLFHSQL